jgi:hypothetical protein
MAHQWEVQPGMTVWTHRGERLGQVVEVREDELIVERGFLWTKRDYAVPREDVREVIVDEVHLNHGPDSLFFAPREITREDKASH